MENAKARGTVPGSGVIGTPDDLWRTLRRVLDGAKGCLARHCERMKTDPAYREFVDRVIEQLSSRPGQAGKSVRIVAAGHAFLLEVL